MAVCNKIRFFPRAGLNARMENCVVYGSNTSATADLVALHTITGVVSGWNEQMFANSTDYRFYVVRRTGIDSAECAELEFYNGATKLTVVNIFSSPSLAGFEAARAFDGNTGTEWANDGSTNPTYIGMETHPAPTITTTTLPGGVKDSPYNQQLQVTGGTGSITWSLEPGNSLPSGLSLLSSGIISGTVTAEPGTYNFTVRATDAINASDTQALSITVSEMSVAFAAPAVVAINTNFTITNLSNGVTSYSVSKGDGSAATTDPAANFQYAAEGTYRFQLTGTTGAVTKTAVQTVRAIYDTKTFPLEFSKLGSGSEFATTITTSPTSGYEQRIKQRSRARDRFNAAFSVRTLADAEVLRNFFLNVGGRFETFLLKDVTDYRSARTATASVGTGSLTTFQIRKAYRDYIGNNYHRDIKRPKRGTVKVWVNGALQTETTHYTVNYTSTGIVTFVTAPAAAAVVEVECEFYKLVRFDTDFLDQQALEFWVLAQANPQDYGLVQVPDIPLVEVFS